MVGYPKLLHSIVKGHGAPHNLWLHGFFGSGANFGYVSRFVRGTNYLLDLRNHGDSFHGFSESSETAAQDILTFAERNNIEKFNLIGHSFGGRVATVAAHMAPEMIERLVVVDIGLNHTWDIYKQQVSLWRKLDSFIEHIKIKGRSKRTIYHELLSYTKDVTLSKYIIENLGGEAGYHYWKTSLPNIINDWEQLEALPNFNDKFPNPALAICGGLSAYTVWNPHFNLILDEYEKHFDDWDYEIVPDVEHYPHNFAPEQFANKINSFIGV